MLYLFIAAVGIAVFENISRRAVFKKYLSWRTQRETQCRRAPFVTLLLPLLLPGILVVHQKETRMELSSSTIDSSSSLVAATVPEGLDAVDGAVVG